jgi:quercetin dioxygenase-like cupin family protein
MFFDFAKDHRVAIGHAHKYDHVTLLAHGSVSVEADGKTDVYFAPAFIDIKAGIHHKITALEDLTVAYCIHDTRGLDVEDLGLPF